MGWGAQQQLEGLSEKGMRLKTATHMVYALRWQVNKARFLGVSVPLIIKLGISRISEESAPLGMWH